MELFWLGDAQFVSLRPLLPTDTRGVPRIDDQRVISGIVHVLRAGCRWKRCAGSVRTAQDPLQSLRAPDAQGRLGGIFLGLSEAGGPPTALMIDATRVKLHRSAADGKRGPTIRPSAARAAGDISNDSRRSPI